MVKKLWNYFWKKRIFNFMFVGGVGYCVNMGIYYPLTLLIQNQVKFAGQVFYLPALLVSNPITIVFNYYLNKRLTYKDCKVMGFGLGKYMTVCMGTVLFDMAIIFGLVQYIHIYYLVAVVLAAVIMFGIRYWIVNKWIWNTQRNKEVVNV